MVRTAAELPAAMVNAFAYGSEALLERFVVGNEVAVPVLDDGSGPRALPVVSIAPDGGVYDYTARYTAGSTEFRCPRQARRRGSPRSAPGSPWPPTRPSGCATCPAPT